MVIDEHYQFFVPSEQIRGNDVLFPEEEARHMAKVLRKKSGEVVRVTDGKGIRMDVLLTGLDKTKATGRIVTRTEEAPEPERILAVGLLRKRERMEFAIEKAVELGATRIILVRSDHTVKTKIKIHRVDKVIISALKQSHRCRIPAWEMKDSFNDVLTDYSKDRQVIAAHPVKSHQPLRQTTESPLLLLVGPEGGFSDAEIENVASYGANFANLAKTRLRTETAVCALLALVENREKFYQD